MRLMQQFLKRAHAKEYTALKSSIEAGIKKQKAGKKPKKAVKKPEPVVKPEPKKPAKKIAPVVKPEPKKPAKKIAPVVKPEPKKPTKKIAPVVKPKPKKAVKKPEPVVKPKPKKPAKKIAPVAKPKPKKPVKKPEPVAKPEPVIAKPEEKPSKTETPDLGATIQAKTEKSEGTTLEAEVDTTRTVPPVTKKAPTIDRRDATIFITTIPPKAKVYMDGKYIGESNYGNVRVATGTHEMKFVINKQTCTRRITFKPGKNRSILIRVPCKK